VSQAGRAGPVLKSINLALLIAYPVAWTAPLMRAGLDLPLFGLSEISVLSGLASLWQTDIVLAAVVTLFALVAPYAKTIGLALIHAGRLPRRGLGLLQLMGKLAMADIFLIALYITVVKGIGLARIETAWGLYLFSGCVIASLVIGWLTDRRGGSGAG
jgi:paraquat-inducible protein A